MLPVVKSVLYERTLLAESLFESLNISTVAVGAASGQRFWVAAAVSFSEFGTPHTSEARGETKGGGAI